MATIKVKLAFDSQKPVNFKIGDNNISIGLKPSMINKEHADLIMKQYPGWIETVAKKTTKTKTTTKEA